MCVNTLVSQCINALVSLCDCALVLQAVTLSCAHSFCQHCIGAWRKRSGACPIYQQDILSQTRSLVLDNYIEHMVDTLSTEMKERRKALLGERNGERCTETSQQRRVLLVRNPTNTIVSNPLLPSLFRFDAEMETLNLMTP